MPSNLKHRYKSHSRSTYNMKVIIRGDRQTGKSILLHRLDGGNFNSEHIPTPEIQISSVGWTYKTTDEMVKLEVWDIVERAIIPKLSDTGPLKSQHMHKNRLPIDSSSVDVYKG